MTHFNVLIIGSGIAGLSLANRFGETVSVGIFTKKEEAESNTNYAQGGLAAVMNLTKDSYEKHVKDTLAAGDGLCDEDVVRMVVEEGPGVVRDLLDWGVNFAKHKENNEEFDLGREGGHSERRVLHAGDITGREIERALVDTSRKKPNIKIFENHIGVDLITTHKLKAEREKKNRILGAYFLNKNINKVITVSADVVVLATGGAGKVFLYTSNPDISTGDGVAMAKRAGANIANMEFYQFHPTILYHPEAKSFLISEALRGEGGVLRLKDGTPFMDKVHPLKSLAPRDIVARTIDFELKRTGDDCVYLDMSHKSREFLEKRFPDIFKTTLSFGIDMSKKWIPVVPAAHYLCGGVLTDKKGLTSIDNLYAIGEVACTGLHGANRLASNSLLEGCVFAKKAYEATVPMFKKDKGFGKGKAGAVSGMNIHSGEPVTLPEWKDFGLEVADELIVITHNWDELRRAMWNYVGIVRSNKRLERAKRRIDNLIAEIKEYYWNFKISPDLLELRNIAEVANLIITSASLRKESRGTHYNIDYPYKDDTAFKHPTIL
ncbi:MAG: L-aspartate oxidase [Candidatus Acidulodesulfobacterium ferriphilum]|uniref:L-aspartate oxidase n=1 Tax=Candidatus Acidulodesulfobacterium ferriphilum TaxID=2597223 RepID=A0A519BB52_9DELT|nr:MAG: L-aspartate oxidase [Candidatus Acidulodesulfobacterium ferriphilum]